MRTGMTKDLQKLIDKHGSVLKAYIVKGDRTFKAMMRAIILLVCFILLLHIFFILIYGQELGALSILFVAMYISLFISGSIFYKSRRKNYLSFYQAITGYTAEELQLADREFMGAGAVCIVGRTDRAKEDVLFIVTEHYFMSVWPVRGCYVLKLEDIAAVFYSCQIPKNQESERDVFGCLEGLHIISKQDTQEPGEVKLNGKELSGFTNTLATDQAVCMEVIEEITKRVPHVITSQNIVVNGIQYDLVNLENWQADWKKITKELA